MQFDKRQLYETDIRVPYFVRCPGCTEGVELDEPVSHVKSLLSVANIRFNALRPRCCHVLHLVGWSDGLGRNRLILLRRFWISLELQFRNTLTVVLLCRCSRMRATKLQLLPGIHE